MGAIRRTRAFNDSMTENPDPTETYAEGSVLTELLGDHPKVKILTALLSENDHDITITDISELAGLSRSAVYDHIDDLIGLNVVHKTREIGGSPMYEINRESDVAEDLAHLEWDLIRIAEADESS